MFTVVVVASAVGGLAIGSFLNVVIYRVPWGQSVMTPPSACPSCASPVAPRDNIPLVSWVALRGRCRHCHARIAVRYPVVEALTALLFGLTAVRLGVSWSLLPELAFVGGLVALAAIDLEHFLLPRAIVYPTLLLVSAGLVVAAGATGQWRRLAIAAACGLGSFLLFYVINYARPAWLGFGDVRLAGLLGLALGWMGPWYLLVGFLAANLVGALVGMALMAAGKATRRTRMPYGVFLGAGAIFALLLGATLIAWYSHTLRR